MKRFLISLAVVAALGFPCVSFCKTDKLLQVVKLPANTCTKDKITALLGKPTKSEQLKKTCR